jgi:hypothetical protein
MLSGIELTGVLGDVVFLAITVAFFGLCVLFVRACDIIAGPEATDAREGGVVEEPAAREAAPELTEVAR